MGQYCDPRRAARALRAAIAVTAIGLCPAVTFAQAEAGAELERLQSALGVIQQTQQSVYQQFQMVQELRRAELAGADPFAPQANVGIAPPPQDYNELRRRREQRDDRIKELTAELERLYARYQELEDQKQPLLERMSELGRRR
jgi:predicted  nucleic acid-binding Zn-ribbon protein